MDNNLEIYTIENKTAECQHECGNHKFGRATKIQSGVTQKRINREPLDIEETWLTWSDLEPRLGPGLVGTLYDGMVISITDDPDDTYNGPWIIRWQNPDDFPDAEPRVEKNTYFAIRLWDEEEVRYFCGFGHLE